MKTAGLTLRANDNNPTSDDKSWFLLGNEYLDFLEFLEDELGLDHFKEIKEKFDKINFTPEPELK